jgi:hypothetical protein
MASIYTKDWENELNYLCSGALISEKFVLTVAACLWQPEPQFVKLGSNQKLSKYYEIDYFTRHPNYKFGKRNLFNVGLIKLKENILFNKNIRPACLPLDDSNLRKAIFMQSEANFLNYGIKLKSPVVFDVFNDRRCLQKFLDRKIFDGLNQVFCVGELSAQNVKCSVSYARLMHVFIISNKISLVFLVIILIKYNPGTVNEICVR